MLISKDLLHSKVARGSTSTVKYIEAFNNPYVKLLLACKICNKEMPVKYPGNWKQHYLSHASSSEKPFKCNHCDKSFIRGDRLKNHVIKHHPEVAQTTPQASATNLKQEDVKQEFHPLPNLALKMEDAFQWNTILNN